MNKLLAVLLTALFLTPFFTARAETAPVLAVDETAVLRGMDRSWQQGYTPAVSGGRWTMILPVRSDQAAGALKAELIVNNERVTPFKAQAMSVEAREEERGLWAVRFSLNLLPDQKNADYPCTVRITGRDKEMNALSLDYPLTVEIRGAKESLEKPRIAVTGVRADLSVGEEGTVQVSLANPCAAANITDLELKMTDASGHILPLNSDTLKIGSLPIGESVTVDYPVTVLEKATVTPHMLKLDFSWTAAGQAATWSENNTVSVRQEIRLEQGGLRMAQSVTAGDSVTMTLPVMNMGKADVVNVLATVTLPGVTERQSVLVGTIQPGETKQAQLILSPGKDIAGEFDGTLTVECTDQDGNPASFELPVSLRVEKPKPKESKQSTAGTATAGEKPALLTWILAGGCGLLLTMLTAQSIVLRRKLRLLEEEKL